jgi:hypothetical protein
MRFALAIALSFAGVLISAATFAQDGAIPEEALKELGYFVGDWKAKIEYGDKTTEGTWSAKWSAKGTCLAINISESTKDDNGEPVTTFATGLMGWDAPTKSIKEVNFWSNGDTYDARYEKASDTLWEGKANGVVGGKEYTEKVSLTRNGPKEFVWKAYDYVLGGQKQHDLIVTMSKADVASQDHEKLDSAFGWLIGKWELVGTSDEVGDFVMTFTFGWDIGGTVVDWRNDFVTETSTWAGEARHYWDPVDEKIKTVSFTGFGGGPRQGELKECGKNSVVWSSNVVDEDGSQRQQEFNFSLQDDGSLLFLHFGILDDGSRRENFRFELTKK